MLRNSYVSSSALLKCDKITRYPTAELVKPASAKSVVLTLQDVFDLFRNPI